MCAALPAAPEVEVEKLNLSNVVAERDAEGVQWACGTTPTKPATLAADLADPAIGPALLDFLSGNASGITAANRVNRLKAWEALFDYSVFRKNIDHLDYTENYLTRTGKTKQQFLDDLDEFEDPKKIFLDELDDTPASGTYANNPSGVWNENPFLRGREIEDVLGQNLHDNFPFIDKFDDVDNSVTSIKSTDTYAKTYQSLDNLEALWKKYVDDLVAMPPPNVGVTFDGVTVSGYNKQILEIAIPDPLVGGSVDVLTSVTNYAKGKGVCGSDIEIIIQVIE